MGREEPGLILFIVDDRVSRDQSGRLLQLVQSLKPKFHIESILGQDTNEAALLERIQKTEPTLLLAPVHHYQSWNRIEGHFGMNRKGGPTFAGYFCESTPLFKIPEPTGQMRRILLDFVSLDASELGLLLGSLNQDTQRSGLRALVDPNTPIYYEAWYANQGQGNRIDTVLNLPEIAKSNWRKRSSSVRLLLSALWSLVYEEGPGKSNLLQVDPSKSSPKAYFQIAADANSLSLRLYYYTLPHLSPKDAIKQFWPNPTTPGRASQTLVRYSDFVRVHSIAETADVEIVVGLLPSAPAEKSVDHLRTLWIEPLAAKLLNSPPYEAPDPNTTLMRPLSPTSHPNNPEAASNSSAQILDLKKKLTEKEEKIKELRSGGIGTATVPPPPDAEGLLEAFQQRYFEAKLQIRQFELQIDDLTRRGGTEEELRELQLKVEALLNRQRSWIKKLMTTLDEFRKSAKKTK